MTDFAELLQFIVVKCLHLLSFSNPNCPQWCSKTQCSLHRLHDFLHNHILANICLIFYKYCQSNQFNIWKTSPGLAFTDCHNLLYKQFPWSRLKSALNIKNPSSKLFIPWRRPVPSLREIKGATDCTVKVNSVKNWCHVENRVLSPLLRSRCLYPSLLQDQRGM